MKYLRPVPDMMISEIVAGCMRISTMEQKELIRFIESAKDCGINFFDHADIYGKGESEAVFAKAFKHTSLKREDIYLQSKCGIINTDDVLRFDFSKEHILKSVDGILQRLQTDYIDVLLLHRPDALVEPEQVAEALTALQQSGKVRHFGVSNHNPLQIELLKRNVQQKLIFNQLQMSVMFTGMIDAGLNVNMKNPASIDHDNSVLDYCRLHDITVQAWSPYQYGYFEGVFVGNDKFPVLNKVLNEMSEKYGISATAMASAFLLRHPVSMQVVLGTTKPERLQDIATASGINLSHKDWYSIYAAAGNQLP